MSLGELFPQSALEGLYHCESTADSSGNARTLTNNNSVAFSAGRFNNAADGGAANSTKYLSTTNTMNITGGSCTMMCWVKLRSEPSATTWNFMYQMAVGSTFVSNRIRYTDTAGTKTLVFRRERAGTANDDATSASLTLGTTNWNQITYTYNGTTIKGYLNGKEIASASSSGNGAAGGVAGFSLLAAASPAGYVSGFMDECAIWSRALSQREIARIYAVQVGKFK